MKHTERGSFTIEAMLSLTVFMFAFIALVSLATVSRIEGITQYAINQSAKEISRYCYIAEKANLIVNPSDGSKAKADSVDEVIQAVYDFSDTAKEKAGDPKDISSAFEQLKDFNSDDFAEISAAAKKVYQSAGPIMDDPKGTITAMAEIFASKGLNRVVSRVIAQPLCKVIVPKYITSSGDVDEMLKKAGIEDGLDGLDFSMSTFLMDGRTINIVLVYKVKVNGFGMFDQEIVVKQTASTAAWIKGTKLEDIATAESKWGKSEFERGKEFVAALKDELNLKAVKSGQGIDLYDQDKNEFSSVHSINVFSASYSEYKKVNSDASSADNYILNKSKIKSTVKGYATKLKRNVDKINDTVKMEDGTETQIATDAVQTKISKIILVVPTEAKDNSENLAKLNQIAKEIKEETGVEVFITYRETALGGK